MIAVDPIQAVKAGVFLLAGSLLVFGGCQWQRGVDEDKIEALQTAVAEKRVALDAAAKALKGASEAILAVNAQADANIAAAKAAAHQATQAATQARRDRIATAQRVESLERQLEKERTSCKEGQARVCGTPLR